MGRNCSDSRSSGAGMGLLLLCALGSLGWGCADNTPGPADDAAAADAAQGDLLLADGVWRLDAPGGGDQGAGDLTPGTDSGSGVNLVPVLLARLKQIQQADSFLFGQQHANWSSRAQMLKDGSWGEWKPTQATDAHWSIFRSDMEVTTAANPQIGQALRPAVHGFSATAVLKSSAASRARYAAAMVQAFQAGSLVTMHWPADNPVVASDPVTYPLGSDKSNDGGNNDARGSPVTALVAQPGGQPSQVWTDVWLPWLVQLKQFVLELQARTGGQAVPLLLRPFHEMLGDSHWWSVGNTPAVGDWCAGTNPYQQLFRRTVDALRQPTVYQEPGGIKKTLPALDNLVLVWSPGRPFLHKDSVDFRCLYPGDGWVDVIAFDIYTKDPALFASEVVEDAKLVTAFATQHGKIAAIAEFGHKDGLGAGNGADLTNWYLDRFLKPLRNAGLFTRLAYAATWSNSDAKYWIPLSSFHDTHPTVVGVERRYQQDDPMMGFRALINAPESLMLGQATLYK